MVSENNILDRVVTVVSEQLGVSKDKIQLSSRFVEDLKVDSLDQVEMVMRLEEEFGVSIPDGVAAKFLTVDDVVEYIKQNR